MVLVVIIDLAVILGLLAIANSKGLEQALPLAAFVIVLTPIESIIPLGVFSLTTHRIVVALLIFLYLQKQSAQSHQGNLPLKNVLIVSVMWSLVATVNSIVPSMSIKKLLSVVLEYYALYFVYWKSISRIETIQKILLAIVLALGVCSMWGTVEAYRNFDLMAYLPAVGHHFDEDVEMERDVRIRATYDHPILYGAALAAGIPIAFHLLAQATRTMQGIWLSLSLLLMSFNLYKTSSRGPWLGAVVGCVLLFLLGTRQHRRNLSRVVVLGVAILVLRPGIWATVQGLFENTLDENTSTGSSYAYRHALPKAAVHALLDKPSARALWGYGPESFYDVHLTGMFLGKPHVFLSCDNAWVEFLIESGFAGLLIMIVLLWTPVYTAWAQYRTAQGPAKYLALLCFINLVVFYVQMYSVGMYSWGQNGYIIWILIALTYALARFSESPSAYQPTEGGLRLLPVYGKPEWWLQKNPWVPVSSKYVV